MLAQFGTIGRVFILGALTGCATTGGSLVDTTSSTPFVQTADARSMAGADIPSVSGSRAQEVQASFVGSRDEIVNGLGPDLYAAGPVPAPVVQRYLESVRDKLLAQWPYERPVVPYRIEILPSFGYGADSFANGVIRIPIGILEKSGSESEVAFIIGHEAGHLLLKHQLRREGQVGAAEREAQTLRYAGELRAITKRKHKGTETKLQAYAKNVAISTADTASGMLVNDAMEIIFDAGWGRKQEEQADLVGIDLMTKAGYNPSYTDDVFDAVISAESQAALEGEALKSEAAGSSTNLPDLLKMLNPANMIYGPLYSLNERVKTLVISHPATVARREAAVAYRDKYYAAALGVTARGPDGLARLKLNPAYGAMVMAVKHARASNEYLADGNTALALSEARTAEELEPSWWASHYLIGCAMLQQGPPGSALAEMQRALAMPGVPYGAFERIAFEYVSRNNVPAAFGVMAAAEQHFGGPEVTWPDRIVLYRVQDNKGGADSTLTTCSKSDNARQRDKCSEAARRPLELAANTPLFQPGQRGLIPPW